MKHAVKYAQIEIPFAAMNRRGSWLGAGYLFVCLLPAVFTRALLNNLIGLVLNDQTLSHIPLIPVLSSYFLFTERKLVFAGTRRRSALAAAIALAGAASVALARVNPFHWDSYSQSSLLILGFVLIWTGTFGIFFGEDAMRAARFPLLFLWFAIPIPKAWLSHFIALLQYGSADAVAVIFRMIHVPAVRQGFEFSLPGITIRVAEECSGIRSTLALIMTGVLAGHVWLRSSWRTLLLALATIPISIAKNAMRIAVLSWLAVYINPRFLTGPIHHQYGGLLFFSAGLVMVGIALAVLRGIRVQNPTATGQMLSP